MYLCACVLVSGGGGGGGMYAITVSVCTGGLGELGSNQEIFSNLFLVKLKGGIVM